MREPTSLVAGDIDMAEAGLPDGDKARRPPTTRSESCRRKEKRLKIFAFAGEIGHHSKPDEYAVNPFWFNWNST